MEQSRKRIQPILHKSNTFSTEHSKHKKSSGSLLDYRQQSQNGISNRKSEDWSRVPTGAGGAPPTSCRSPRTSPRPFSNTSDLGVVLAGFLDKVSIGPVQKLSQRKRRFVVLTQNALHWYKREEGDELFGEAIGSVSLKDVSKVCHIGDNSFRLTCKFRNRLFVAPDAHECDLWVTALEKALRKVRRSSLRAADLLLEETEESEDAITLELILVKESASLQEVVIAHEPSFGTKIPLENVKADDLITLKFSGLGGYVSVSAESIKANIGNLKPMRFPSSNGEGYAWVRVVVTDAQSHLATAPSHEALSWFQERELLQGILVGFFAIFSVMNHLSLAILGYLLWHIYHDYREAQKLIGEDVCLVVEKYEWVDEDAALEEKEEAAQIPAKFLEGCGENVVEARRRWDITRAWREEFDVDSILKKPHPHFHTIKQHWPHYILPHPGKNGDPVYIERTGEFKMPLMLEKGIATPELLHHSVYCTEYMYKYIYDREDRKLITVYDLVNANLGDLKGEAKVFLRKGLGLIQQHYPERSSVILIVNAPIWFSILWRILKPLLNEQTVKKIRIAAVGAETSNAFREFMEIQHIPEEYGGSLHYESPDGCRWQSRYEVALCKWVEDTNAKCAPNEPAPRVDRSATLGY